MIRMVMVVVVLRLFDVGAAADDDDAAKGV